MNKQSWRNTGKAILTTAAVGIFICGIGSLISSKNPEPAPISVPGTSIQRIGEFSYEVTAYKVSVDGMTFLVVSNNNKGGIAVTPIQR